MIMGCFKNPRKSKWFLVCFRPEESLKSNTGSERNTLHPNILFALANDKRDSCPANNDGGKSGRRRFHRAFKTIFSNTASSLSKKKRNKRSGKEPCTNISSKFEKIFNTPSEKKSKSLLESVSISSHSSLFSSPRGYSSMRSLSSSSSVSSMVSNSRSGSGRKQTCMIDMKESKPYKTTPTQQKKKEDGNFSPEIGLYFMLIICLVGLIFWGKAFAILCTSACLFLVPCIFKGLALEESDDDSIDIDSDEYKKRVIMEGLLERDHPRRPYL